MLMGGQEGGDGACQLKNPSEILTFSTVNLLIYLYLREIDAWALLS